MGLHTDNREITALDEVWFDELSQIKIKYNKLLSPDFIATVKRGDWGEYLQTSDQPFTFSELEKENIARTEYKIEKLRLLVASDTTVNKVVQKLWLEKLSGMSAQLALLVDLQALVCRLPQARQTCDVQVSMGLVMGAPNEELFAMTMAELQARLHDKQQSQLLVELGLDSYTDVLPSFSSFADAYPRVTFPPVTPIDQSRIESVEALKSYMEKALQDMNLHDSWVIQIDVTRKYHRVQVSYKKRIIIIPSVEAYKLNGKKYVVTANTAFRLMVHEIGTHALRSTNGYLSPLKLLAVGLDGYLLGEEGVATFREQQYLSTEKYFEGFQSYLAICLAYGLDQKYQMRSPAELYTILYKINLALFYKNDTFARYSAWKRILRTYITLPGQSGAIINTKDLVYREGNTRIHKLFATTNYSDEAVNVGVYDPSNEGQVADLISLGILK